MENRFVDLFYWEGYWENPSPNTIKDFISSELSAQRQQMAEKVRGMKKKHYCKAERGRCDGEGCCMNEEGMNGWEQDGFNSAIESIAKGIEDNK